MLFLAVFRLGFIFTFLGAFIFYLLTNFGVWSMGSYGYTIDVLINCYILAIPFFVNTIISTIIFSLVIEGIYKLIALKNFKKKFNDKFFFI